MLILRPTEYLNKELGTPLAVSLLGALAGIPWPSETTGKLIPSD